MQHILPATYCWGDETHCWGMVEVLENITWRHVADNVHEQATVLF